MIAIVGNRQTFITIPSSGISQCRISLSMHLSLVYTFAFSKQFQFCVSTEPIVCNARCVSLIFVHFAYRLFILNVESQLAIVYI